MLIVGLNNEHKCDKEALPDLLQRRRNLLSNKGTGARLETVLRAMKPQDD